MIEDLLTELSASGWTISWAYQYAPNEWRVSIVHELEWNSRDQPDYYHAHCAFAPTFAEALEDAMSKRAEAEFEEGSKISHTTEPPKGNLLSQLSLFLRPQSAPFKRRV